MTVNTVQRSMIALVAAAVVGAGVGSAFADQAKMPASPEKPMTIEPKLEGMVKRPGYPSDPKALFKLLDGDGDGQLSRAEWKENIMAVFFIRDADRDLKLSQDELPGVSPELFAAADVDGDGFLSGYEFNQAEFTQFEAADVDDAGSITEDEFIAYLDGMHTAN